MWSRSALTNGRQLVPGAVHRSPKMQPLRDLVIEHEQDLGGSDYVSTSERRVVRRAAMLTFQLERLDARFMRKKDGTASLTDFETYQRGTNTLRRTLETLGLQRRQRDVTPTLGSLLRQGLEDQP